MKERKKGNYLTTATPSENIKKLNQYSISQYRLPQFVVFAFVWTLTDFLRHTIVLKNLQTAADIEKQLEEEARQGEGTTPKNEAPAAE